MTSALTSGSMSLPLWSFLLGSGLRIGELVWPPWSNVDLESKLVRINRFATTLGCEVVESTGKSRDALRTIELDDHLVAVLISQGRLQADEGNSGAEYVFEGTRTPNLLIRSSHEAIFRGWLLLAVGARKSLF